MGAGSCSPPCSLPSTEESSSRTSVVTFFSDRGLKLLSGPDTLLSQFSFHEDQFVKGLDYMQASLGPRPVCSAHVFQKKSSISPCHRIHFHSAPVHFNQLSEKTTAFVYIWLILCMKPTCNYG